MKKLAILFAIITLILCVVACAPVTDGPLGSTPPSTTIPGTTQMTPSTGESSTLPPDTQTTVPSESQTTAPPETSTTTPPSSETNPIETKPTKPKPTEPTETIPKPTDPPHIHQYTETSSTEPSCTQDGYIILKCECGETLRETLPKVEHDYAKTERKEPTCTSSGFIKHICECGAARVEILPQKEHKYTQTKITPATCTTTGKKLQSCICGASITTSIPKTEHQYKEAGRTAPSCTKEGKITYKCSCGAEKYEAIEKVKHEYQLTETIESTTTKHGKKVYTCKNCSASYSEELPLKKTAKETDMCGPSLLNKPMKHAQYGDIVQQLFDRVALKPTQKESFALGVIKCPDTIAMNTFWTWWNDTYKYAAYLYWYTSYQYDDPARDSGFLIWGDDKIYQEEQDCYNEVYRILAELKIDSSVTQYEAIVRINNYLCENRYYEYDSSKKDGSVRNSIFGPSGVCHNYALAFQMLCLGAGIECHYYSSNTMSHAWNKVYFSDGSFYWVDVCWNDVRYIINGKEVETSVENGVPAAKVKELRSRYLLITTEQLLKNHTM